MEHIRIYKRQSVYKIQEIAQADNAGPTTILGLEPKPLMKDLRPECDLKWGKTMRGEFLETQWMNIYNYTDGTDKARNVSKSIIKYENDIRKLPFIDSFNNKMYTNEAHYN